jgi:phenylacetate-coenzyme A ligase PaaK-like adenylate-forming protein
LNFRSQQVISAVIYQRSSPTKTKRGADHASQVRDYSQLLTMTERMSSKELQAAQGPLVAKLLLHARRNTNYYKDKLDLDLCSAIEVAKSWSTIPILTRAEAVKSRFKLMSRKARADLGPVTEEYTSGATGMPLAFRKNAASDIVSAALTERMFRWWSIDGAKSFAQIASYGRLEAPPPEGKTITGWHSSHPRGVKHFISVQADIDTHLNWLMARRPNYFGTYAPILKELAHAVKRRGVELQFDALLSFATVLDDDTRESCRTAFGAEIADTYGTSEVGHIAAQCRECGEYHISMEAVVVEVLRTDGLPAGPGEIGRVIVTPLYNYAMPLIRYELGDMAEVGSHSPSCGRKLPTLRRILGRYRNLFRFRDGSTIWPVSSAFRLGQFLALKQFQVIQTDFDRIEIRFVPADTSPATWDLTALTQRVRTVLRQPVTVVVREVEQIERASNGKYEECISLVHSN